MATAPAAVFGDVLHQWGSESMDGPPDEALLERFLEGDETESEASFRALVIRHGPMVLGVCRHILDGIHDAEDAFQATFLVLARNAGAIRDRRVLARWLYEVAYRIAVRSKSRASRRRDQEKEAGAAAAAAGAVGTSPEFDPAWNELRPVLHEEVNRLPEKYRDAVVLCYLEGRTNEEAAALLSWPVGTVKGRLARARDLLRSRLTRRGLAISATFLAARLSQNTVFAEVVPSRMIALASQNAQALTRGGETLASAVSPELLDLVDHALSLPSNVGLKTAKLATFGGLVAAAIVIGGVIAVLTRGVDVRGADKGGGGGGAPVNAAIAPATCHASP